MSGVPARAMWTESAAPWRAWQEQVAYRSRAATELIVRIARVRPGLRVLDLASGAGEPALALAAAVAPDGHVVATDLVPDMLGAVEQLAHARGLTMLSTQLHALCPAATAPAWRALAIPLCPARLALHGAPSGRLRPRRGGRAYHPLGLAGYTGGSVDGDGRGAGRTLPAVPRGAGCDDPGTGDGRGVGGATCPLRRPRGEHARRSSASARSHSEQGAARTRRQGP